MIITNQDKSSRKWFEFSPRRTTRKALDKSKTFFISNHLSQRLVVFTSGALVPNIIKLNITYSRKGAETQNLEPISLRLSLSARVIFK
jgi:hypothetical protein